MLSGVNKLCQQCQKTCKQWKQVTVVKCPMFLANQEYGTPSHRAKLRNLRSKSLDMESDT